MSRINRMFRSDRFAFCFILLVMGWSFVSNLVIKGNVQAMTVTKEWSDWTEEVLTGDYEKESRSEYRYRDKQKTSGSSSSALSGWTLIGSEITGWGAWSGWSNTGIASSATREVDTRTVPATYTTKTQWNYYRYSNSSNTASTPTQGYNGWNTRFETGWLDAPLVYQGKLDGTNIDCWSAPGAAYWDAWYGERTQGVSVLTAAAYTQWRCRDAIISYNFEKWGEWSGWSSAGIAPTGSASKEVQKRTSYRYRIDDGTSAVTEPSNPPSPTPMPTTTPEPRRKLKKAIVAVNSKNPSFISLSWGKIKGATRYEILRARGKSKKFVSVAKLLATNTTFQDKKAKKGYSYKYKVIAFGEQRSKSTSKVKEVSLSGKPLTPKLSLQNRDKGRVIILRWTKITGGKYLELFLKKEGEDWELFALDESKISDYKYKPLDLVVDPKKRYKMRIRTYAMIRGEKVYSKYSKTVTRK